MLYIFWKFVPKNYFRIYFMGFKKFYYRDFVLKILSITENMFS